MRSYHSLALLAHDDARAEIVAHLDAGGDPRAHDNTALDWACRNGHLDILERLLSLGLTLADARRCFALWMACAYGHLAIVARLLELGFEPTPNALILCGAGRQAEDDDDDVEWSQRLWRAVERWEGSHELQVAESDLTPADLEAWEAAKDRVRPSGLRFAD